MVGLDLPHDPFTIDGRLVRVEDGLRVEEARGTVGGTRVAVDGFIGDPPVYRGTLLDVEVIEPNLSRFSRLLGLTLPDDPVRVSARLGQGEGAIEIAEAKAEIGDASLRVDGQLTTVEGHIGTDLRFDCDGLELADVAAVLDIEGLPDSPVRANGRLTVVDDGLELDRATVEIDEAMLAARGLVSSKSRLQGTYLTIEASGGDASIFDPLLPVGTLPPEGFRVTGGVGFDGDTVSLDGLELTLGDSTGRIEGSVGTLPGLAGTDAELLLSGPSLAALGPLVPGVALPDAAFSVGGGVGVSDDRIELRSFNADLGVVALRLDGQLALVDRFIGSRLSVAGEGVDLGALAAAIERATTTELPGVPAEPFTAAADLVLDEVGYGFEDLEITVGDATLSAAGVVGHWPDMIGTDVELLGHGATASLIKATAGIDGARGSD